MKKQRYAVLVALPLLSLTLFAGHAAAPEEAGQAAEDKAVRVFTAAADRSIPYIFPKKGQTKDKYEEVELGDGSRGIQFSAIENDIPSTGYTHPFYRYTPVEILPLDQ